MDTKRGPVMITNEQKIIIDYYENIGSAIKGHLVDIVDGPIVYNFIVKPGENSKLNTIKKAASEHNYMIAYSSKQINVQIPKETRQVIFLDKLLKTKEFKNTDAILPIIMGVDTFGEIMIKDLRKLPHMLVCGRTGCGISVFFNSLLKSLKSAVPATECKFIIIDPKGADYDIWKSDKHLMCPMVKLDAKAAVQKLQEVTELIDERYQKLQNNKVKNVEEYKKKTNKKDMPYIVVVIDEVADLRTSAKKQTELCVQYVAQKARAVGIHLIIGTQRPDALSGIIKANMPTRVSFQARTGVNSMQMLGEKGAENLLPNADILFSDAGRIPVRIHTPYVEC